MKMKKFALRGLVTLAVVVALCIFFSGTVRSLTTPKVRFAQVRMGKMEQETELKGQIVFPEEEEMKINMPENLSLTVTKVYVTAGSKVEKGDYLISAKVTDEEKTMKALRKDASAAQKEIRTLEQKTKYIRLTPGEKRWQEAWNAESEAREKEQEARVNLQTGLRQAGFEMTENGTLPEEAGEELKMLFDAWKLERQALEDASTAMAAVERYAIPDDTWSNMQQLQEQEEQLATLEEQMTDLQVLSKTTEKISANRTAYISKINVEKGSTVDVDTVILTITAENTNPVIRIDLSHVKQEVRQGTSITLIGNGLGNPVSSVVDTGLNIEGHPYADVEITQDVIYSLGSVSAMMKNSEVKAKLVTRSNETTCLLPASAVRGSGEKRYVYVGQLENSTFGGSQMKVMKVNVTVLAESGSTVSVAEDLTYQKVLYMEDRALTEGGMVMEYANSDN